PDPLAEKYPNFSPYAHCANNPLKYMDPDGRKLEFAKGVSDSFKADYTKATNHLNSNNAGEMIAKIEASEKVYYINESTNMESKYNSGTKTIDWSPNTAIRTDNLYELSPAEILNHEIDHALQNDQNPEQQTKDSETKDPNYRNKEEKRVVEGSEKQTAIKLNKLKDGEVTRNNLFGNPYKTKGPTSTEGVDELVITPK
ncbi:MAG: M91 family zinc metallopeptidase, partial [Muribaculaceae bacterium]